jgi:hypothetical protein
MMLLRQYLKGSKGPETDESSVEGWKSSWAYLLTSINSMEQASLEEPQRMYHWAV